MIDASQSKTAAWQRVVSELTASAGDERAFLGVLLAALGQVSGARQASLLSEIPSENGPPQLQVLRVWPGPGAGEGPIAQGQAQPDAGPRSEPLLEDRAVRTTTAVVFAQGGTRVVALGRGGAEPGAYRENEPSSVVCVPVGQREPAAASPPRPALVAALLLDTRSKQALQTTLAVVELMAGYAQLAAARQELARTRSSAAALELATRLIASLNSARGFRGAAMQMANDLCRHARADRVAIGWRHGPAGSRPPEPGSAELIDARQAAPVRIVALSDTEQLDRRLAMVRRLEDAMDECADQEQPVLFPLPAAPDPVLSRAVTRSHKELAAGDANLKVLSLPVRDAGETLGVVTVESSAPGQTVDVRTVELLQAALDLVGPVLRLRRSDDRPWPARVAEVLRRAGAWLVGPRQTLWKLAGAAAAALGVVVVTVQVPYRIEAAVSLRPVERRIIAAPFEGTVTEVAEAARAGRRVSAGELLFRLDTSEMELSAVEAQGQMLQAQAQADEAIRRGQGAERQQAEARAEQARARFEFFRSRIDEAAVRAPTDGTLLSGDLSERLGARLTQGEALFEIAPLEEMRVVGTVQDRDIGLLVDAAEAGELRGQLATRAYPGRTFGLTVDRVVPLARAQEGRNVFEVHARIDRAAAWMRPGMEGLAKLDVGDRSLAWIGTRRLADTLRLWLWW